MPNYKQYPSKDQLPDNEVNVIAFGGFQNRLMIAQYYVRKETWLLSDEDGYLANNDEIKWWVEMPTDEPVPAETPDH